MVETNCKGTKAIKNPHCDSNCLFGKIYHANYHYLNNTIFTKQEATKTTASIPTLCETSDVCAPKGKI